MRHGKHRVGFGQVTLYIPQMTLQQIFGSIQRTLDQYRLKSQFTLCTFLQFTLQHAVRVVVLCAREELQQQRSSNNDYKLLVIPYKIDDTFL